MRLLRSLRLLEIILIIEIIEIILRLLRSPMIMIIGAYFGILEHIGAY